MGVTQLSKGETCRALTLNERAQQNLVVLSGSWEPTGQPDPTEHTDTQSVLGSPTRSHLRIWDL